MSSAIISFLLIVVSVNVFTGNTAAAYHEGPDPIAHWVFNRRAIADGTVHARLGPDGKIQGEHKVDSGNGGLSLTSDNSAIVLGEDLNDVTNYLPKREFTVSAWISVNRRRQWGSIICALQDNGSFEKGWIVGYNQKNFYFGISTTSADDGDGRMTYLSGNTDYEVGKIYHVVAVYDGSQMRLYVNGKLDGNSTEQSGDVLYPASAPYVIGAYRDDDENYSHIGRMLDIAVYDLAAKQEWVVKEFGHRLNLTQLAFSDVAKEKFAFVVPPFLQMVTQHSIVVGWETSHPGTSVVHHGENQRVATRSQGEGSKFIHHVKLENLEPNTQYFYRVESTDNSGQKLEGEVLTFQTAPAANTPFAFAVISDTQSNPKVAGIIAGMAWEQRPSFLIHPGDLVGTGTNDQHWTQQFFPSMGPLIGRVAMFPVLGNHEINARNYYDYFQLPDPEYYYEFEYSDARFFMIDSNKKVDSESEQYQWLDDALGKSAARWNFVVHHHPPYSSDENDYGDLWKSNRSTRGDKRIRELAVLYDKHDVDIVFNGHIHSYERTWPVFDEQVIDGKGTIYMVTGGGGGSLETPGPYRPVFQNNVKRGHHYCMVHVNGAKMEFKAFDINGRLFDYFSLEK